MQLKIRCAGILLLYCCMFGCSSIAIDTDPGKPIQFVDLPIFDQQVERALQAKPEQVTIALLDKVKPSQIPDRLRLWITSAQKAGANVDIELPAGEIQPRGIPLLSLIPSLLSFIKFSDAARSPAADLHGYNVKIQLKTDSSGDRLIDHVSFKRVGP